MRVAPYCKILLPNEHGFNLILASFQCSNGLGSAHAVLDFVQPFSTRLMSSGTRGIAARRVARFENRPKNFGHTCTQSTCLHAKDQPGCIGVALCTNAVTARASRHWCRMLEGVDSSVCTYARVSTTDMDVPHPLTDHWREPSSSFIVQGLPLLLALQVPLPSLACSDTEHDCYFLMASQLLLLSLCSPSQPLILHACLHVYIAVLDSGDNC